jgi:hypothetical protein
VIRVFIIPYFCSYSNSGLKSRRPFPMQTRQSTAYIGCRQLGDPFWPHDRRVPVQTHKRNTRPHFFLPSSSSCILASSPASAAMCKGVASDGVGSGAGSGSGAFEGLVGLGFGGGLGVSASRWGTEGIISGRVSREARRWTTRFVSLQI